MGLVAEVAVSAVAHGWGESAIARTRAAKPIPARSTLRPQNVDLRHFKALGERRRVGRCTASVRGGGAECKERLAELPKAAVEDVHFTSTPGGSPRTENSLGKGLARLILVPSIAAAAAVALTFAAPSAEAADVLKTCACLFENCSKQLARCVADPSCAANIACLNTCNDRPDEVECQIGCGDLFENKIVDAFNKCAITDFPCVPRKEDEGRFPIPEPTAIVQSFNPRELSGRWYITAGLNPSFDVFDCQGHDFRSTDKGFEVTINWRTPTVDGGFRERTTEQRFVQDPEQPALLLNHDNEFLHYKDDWYIVDQQMEGKADDFVYVYYRGSNDAWDGYGGAVVYTRASSLPKSIIPQMEEASSRVGLKWSSFRETDNTCGPQPTLVAKAGKAVIAGEEAIIAGEQAIIGELVVLEKTEEKLLEGLGRGIQEVFKDVKILFQGLSQTDIVKRMEAMGIDLEDLEDAYGGPISLREIRGRSQGPGGSIVP